MKAKIGRIVIIVNIVVIAIMMCVVGVHTSVRAQENRASKLLLINNSNGNVLDCSNMYFKELQDQVVKVKKYIINNNVEHNDEYSLTEEALIGLGVTNFNNSLTYQIITINDRKSYYITEEGIVNSYNNNEITQFNEACEKCKSDNINEEEVNITEVFFDEASGKKEIGFYTPIEFKTEKGNEPAILMGMLNLQNQKLTHIFLHLEYSSALIDKNGNYIIKDKEFLGNNFYDFIEENSVDKEGEKIDIEDQIFSNEKEYLDGYKNQNLEDVVILHHKLNYGKDWFFVSMIKETDLSNTNVDYGLGVILVGFLTCLIGIYVIYFRKINKVLSKSLNDAQKAREIADEANRAKGSFLSRVSHDMRTPMNSILGLANLAINNDGATKKELRNTIDKIYNSSNYLLSLINDTLDMSKIERGKLHLNFSPMRLDALIQDVKIIVSNSAKTKGLKFEIDESELPDDYILFDKLRLQQIIINILNNSIKFTSKDGVVTLKISELEKKSNKMKFCITCKDTGIGMSEEFMSTMFLPFTQEKGFDINQELKGTGLGLSIVKSLVEIMDGSIEVDSKINKGTTIKITLTADIANELEIEKNELKCNDLRIGDINGKRILLVEDNDINVLVAEKLLQQFGFNVEVARNGKIAVDMFKNSTKNYYDVILMDFRMPVMNGLDATRIIRELNRIDAKRVSIIAMTADAFDVNAQEAFEAGMDDFIAKPIEPSVLFNKILENLKNE